METHFIKLKHKIIKNQFSLPHSKMMDIEKIKKQRIRVMVIQYLGQN